MTTANNFLIFVNKYWLGHDALGFSPHSWVQYDCGKRVQTLICSGTLLIFTLTSKYAFWSLCVSECFFKKTLPEVCYVPHSTSKFLSLMVVPCWWCYWLWWWVVGFTAGVLLALNTLNHDDLSCYKLVYSNEPFLKNIFKHTLTLAYSSLDETAPTLNNVSLPEQKGVKPTV